MKQLIILVLTLVILGNVAAREWYENAVFYQIYPKSLKDSDGNGMGDLKGITSKLQHLKDLGIDGAWLSPIFKSPQYDGGYDIEDFRTVEPLFGTNQDLDDLLKEAKKLGIRILLDFVPNHTSHLHEWFIKSENNETAYRDYYIWRDARYVNGKRTEPNNWLAVFHTPAWTWSEKRQQYYLHQFAKQQPDLNFRNAAVRKEMNDIFAYWLEKGVDGFRIDAINHAYEVENFADEAYIDSGGDKLSYDNMYHNHTMNLDESYELVYTWRKMMDDYSTTHKIEPKFLMTEAYAPLDMQVRWYGSADGKVKGAHMPFNFALITDLNDKSNAADFQKACQKWNDAKPSYGINNWVLGNHDQSRFGSRYGEDRHDGLALMTMTLPGINVVYYGEEILMLDNRDITWEETQDPRACNTNETVYQLHTRDPERTPFQWDRTLNAGFSTNTTKTWLPVHKNYKEKNLELQKNNNASTYNLYKQLISLRKTNLILRDGAYEGKALGDSVFAFARHTDNGTIVVAINLRKEDQKVDLTQLKNTEKKWNGTVVISTSKSGFKVDQIVDVSSLNLAGYQAVAINVKAGAGSLTIMSILMISAILVLRFFN